jgi:hypothetical protein
MKLGDHGRALALEIAFWLEGLNDPTYPIEEVGKLSLELSTKFRALAIMALLVNSNSDLFCHNLIRSGITRETYLKRLKEKGINHDHHQASGRYEPILDTIAAGDFELGRRIVEISLREWQKGHEYEDDYCYAQILHRLIQETPMEQEIIPFLQQFEAYLDGDPSARLEVCRALVDREQSAFEDAFNALLEEQEAKIVNDRVMGQLETPEVIALRHIFVEGLAILRLAERRGFHIQLEYRYCPSLARVSMSRPLPA